MTFDYISARGDRLPLASNKLFALWHVDGMTTAATSIASNANSSADGDTVNNVRANSRPMVIDLRVREGVDVEEAKREILRVVKLKQTGTLEWTYRDRTIVISGIVEAIDMPRFSNEVTMQITLFCSQPFWEDAVAVVQQISEALDLHYFTDIEGGMLYFPVEGIPLGEYDTIRTKSFHNSGDVAVGMEISIVAFSTVTNPVIYDGNGNLFGVGYGDGAKRVQLNTGDNVVITTHKGNKNVTLNGQSILSKLRPQSTWLQLEAGDNVFTINSDDDSLNNMAFALTYRRRYV